MQPLPSPPAVTAEIAFMQSRSEDMYASAGSRRCAQVGVAGANFRAVATSHCLIGQCSELRRPTIVVLFDAPTPTPQCRAEAHVVCLLLHLVMTRFGYAEALSILLPSPN